MNAAVPFVTPQTLEDQITELAAHISAATWRLLTLIREYDLCSGWNGGGTKSCAHWLNWKCGIALGSAREKVRVAHALAELPQISDAFREGRLSYSKVRAMTRVATPENAAEAVPLDDEQTPAMRRTDALEALAESYLTTGTGDSSGGDRYTVHVHTRVQDLRAAEGADGVSAETSRRESCDCGVVHWLENERGQALDIGRRTRTIPPAIRRALEYRDGGCSFPGCTTCRHVDAHHVVHWADGGGTKLDNLVLLCRYHHRLVHEGGFGVSLSASGAKRFTDPRGNFVPTGPDARFRGNVFSVQAMHRREQLEIGPHTLPPHWDGESMDMGMAIDGMLSRDGG
jgi:hypothetical protein